MNQSHFGKLFFCTLVVLTLFVACAQNTPDAVFNRGLRAYSDGDYLGASIYFEEFIKKFPQDERAFDAYASLADCFMRIKDFASARNIYQEMKNKYPNSLIQISSDFRIAETYLAEGYQDQAIAQYAQVYDATTNPFVHAQASLYMGQVYARQTQMASAETMFNRLYEIAENQIEDPTSQLDLKLQSLTSRASIYTVSGQYDQARDMHTKAYDLISNTSEIAGLEQAKESSVIEWAHTWAHASDFISAATIYDQISKNPAIREQTKPMLIWYKYQSLEQIFTERGKQPYSDEELALVENELDRMVKNYPNHEQTIYARIHVAQLVKDTTPEKSAQYLNEAVDSLRKIISDPPHPRRAAEAQLQIADAYIRAATENYNKAREQLEQVINIYSQVPPILQSAESMLNFVKRSEIERAEAAKNPAPATGELNIQDASPGQPVIQDATPAGP